MKTSKKLLSIVLCLALLLSFPISMAVSAETDEAALKQNIIDAWNAMTKKEGTVLVQAKTPISELPDLGLSAAEIALMGTHYTRLEGDSGLVAQTLKGSTFTGYDEITYSRYAAGTGRIENLITNWSNTVYLEQYQNINETGFVTVDLKAKMEQVTTQREAYYTSAFGGPFYIGSVMGWKNISATVPADATEMDLSALVAAAKATDYSAYTGYDAFSEAVFAAEEFLGSLSEEDQLTNALITAWKALSKEEIVTLVKGTTAISELPDLGLTDEQLAQMGSHFSKFTSGSADNWSGQTRVGSSVSVTGPFDKITYSVYSEMSQAENHFYVEFKEGGAANVPSGWNLVGSGFQTIDVSDSLSDVKSGTKTLGANQIKCDYFAQAGSLYVGSIVGYKAVKAAVPENYAAMDIVSLVAAAKAGDYSDYEGYAAFAEALAAAEEYVASIPADVKAKANLLAAWKTAVKNVVEEITVPLADDNADIYKDIDGETVYRQAVTDATNVGIDDNAKLGTYFVEKLKVSDTGSALYFGTPMIIFTKFEKIPLTQYSSIYYYGCAYDADGNVCELQDWTTQSTQSNHTPSEAFTSVTVNGWTKIPVDSNKFESARMIKILPKEGTVTYISFGSVFGEYTATAALPEGADEMTLSELVVAAKALAEDGYTSEAFTAALAAAEEAIPAVSTDAENGTLEVVTEGNVATVTVTPDEGYVLKAGSLVVYDAITGTPVAVPTRVGFREDETVSNQYTYTATGKVVVKAAFVAADAAEPNMGRIGNSVNTEIAGLRSVYRMPIVDGKVNIGGEAVTVTSYGILICSDVTYGKLTNGLTLEAAEANEYVKNVNFMESASRYDVCADYEDISVMVTGLEDHADLDFWTVAYIVTEAGVYYTDAPANACYNDYAA